MHAEQCVNVGAVREGTWPQSILDQDPLTGHPPFLLQGDTLPGGGGGGGERGEEGGEGYSPLNNWICQNNLPG